MMKFLILMKLNKILFFLFLLFGIEQIQAQVTANFSANSSTGCDPLVVSFTDMSTGNIASWQWSFGNGQSSVLQNPTMTFTGSGFYSVTLIVTESGTGNTDTMTVTDMIHVVASPHALFQVGANNMGCIPLDVDFTDLSTSSDGTITSWSWDMGDGSILTTQNPTHTYTSPGIYSIHLQVTSEYGCVDDTTINNAVHTSTVPDIHIGADITQYCSVPVDIHFTNNSTGSATQTDFSWSFGDGNTSTDENPMNIYTALGDYDVILSVTDEYGCSNTDTFPSYIHLSQVVADFSYSSISTSPDTACLGNEITFTNNSGIYCNWFFGDGTSMLNVSAQDVGHTYMQPGTYTVTLIAAPGDPCADTITKDIYIQQVTASFIADQTTDCKVPFTVNFTDQSSANVTQWDWDFGDTTYSSQQNPSNTYNNFGDYDVSLVVTTNAGCSIGINLNNYIHIAPPEPHFIVDPPDGGCVPITLFFQDSSATSIHDTAWYWHFEGGIPDTAIMADTISILYDSAGAYLVTLTIINDSGCTATVSDSVYVGSHQIPDFFQTHDTICASDSMSFLNLSFDPNLIDTNFWYTIPIDSLGQHGDTTLFSMNEDVEQYYIYHDQIVSDTGLFDVMLVTDYYGCKDTLTVDSALYVHGPIVKHIVPYYNCDTPLTVTFVADIVDGIDWDWDFDDGDTIMYSTEDTIAHTYDTTGVYWVKVNAHNDSTGCDYLDSVQIHVTDVQAVLNMPHENCDGDTVLLNASNSVDANSYYFDFGDGGNSGWSMNSFNIHTFGSDTFVVSLIVRDIHMCLDTVTDTLLSSQPVAVINVDTSNGCAPLTVSFSGDSSYSDFGVASYYWNFMDGTNSHDSDIVHIFEHEGTYNVQLTVIDSLGCNTVATQPVVAYEAHANIIPEDTTLCVGIPVSFYGNDTTYNYQWNFGNNQTASGDTVTVTYSTDSSFVVQQIVTDSHGCLDTAYQNIDVQGVDVVLNVIDSNISCYVTTPLTDAYIQNQTDTAYGTQWLWNFGDGVFSTNYNPGHYYNYPDTFYVSLQATTAYGCVDKDSVWLNVFGPYAVLDFPHDTLCKGEQFTIALNDTMNVVDINGTFGDGNAFTYVPFDYAYSSTGMMNIDINLFSETSHQCGLTLHDSVYVVQVNAYFSAYDINSDTAHCSPLTVNFTDTSQGADTWDWDFGDGQTYSGEMPPAHTYQNPNVQDQTYTIQLAIADQNGCVDTAEHQVVVYGTPEISVSPDQFICKGDSVHLQATANVSGGSPYFIWSPSDGLSNSYVYNPFAFPDTSTLYDVTVYSQHACSNQDSVMITVQNAPTVTYSLDTTIVIGDIADLFIYANQPNVTYTWTPSYGLNCTNCTDVYAQPLETTTYQITYEDSAGCFLQNVNITVFVDEKYSLDVPTAFTPNGDGKNDVVYVKGWGIKNLLEFSIYNRWGEKVFTTNDIKVGWDGTFKGKPQNIDSYVYYAKGELYSGREVEKKGTINLFR